MDKITLLEKVKTGNHSKEQLIGWIQCLPGTVASRKPSKNKVGDIYMHPVFQHPYVLLQRKKGYWICGLITTESKCPEILEPTQSRFFEGQFFTKTIFTATEVIGTWANMYDNPKHLKHILAKLKDILN